MKFCWVTVHVRDMKASLAFYCDLLGLPLQRRINPNPGVDIAFLGSGETEVELYLDREGGKGGFGEGISLGFEVESLEEAVAKLGRAGVSVHSGPFQPGPDLRFLFVQDPDGLLVQLVQRLS